MVYVLLGTETTETAHWEFHRSYGECEWRMVNIVPGSVCVRRFYRLTWVQRCWPRVTPDFGSVRAISSLLFYGIRRHLDARFFGGSGSSSLLGFQAYIRAYIANVLRSAVLWGPRRATHDAGLLR